MHKNIAVFRYFLFLLFPAFFINFNSFQSQARTRTSRDTTSFLNMGLQAYENKDYGLALKYLRQQQSLDSSSIDKNKVILFSTLAKAYAATGQYDKAYEAYDHYMIVKDSLFSIERKATISSMENDYLSTRKDKEITRKQILLTEQKELSKKKNVWITTIAVGGLLIAILCLITYRNYHNKQIIHQKILDRGKKDQEITLLNATIKGAENERTNIAQQLEVNIVSNLSAVQSKFLALAQQHPELKNTSDFKGVLQILEDAQTSLQESALRFNPAQVIENGLLKSIRSFINNIHAAEQLELALQTSGTILKLPLEVELTLYRIVQELVQNIIKHAHASKAEIRLSYAPSHLYLTVSDNGQGFETAKTNDGAGFASVRQRVASLNGTLHIEHEKGISVRIFVPHHAAC